MQFEVAQNPADILRGFEQGIPVACIFDDLESYPARAGDLLDLRGEVDRLLDRDDAILPSMLEEEWRNLGINIGHRAGKLNQRWNIADLSSKQL